MKALRQAVRCRRPRARHRDHRPREVLADRRTPATRAFSLTTVATVDSADRHGGAHRRRTRSTSPSGQAASRAIAQRRCRPDSRARHLTSSRARAASRASSASRSRRTAPTSTSTTPISTATRTSTSSRWAPTAAPTRRRSDRSCSRSSPSRTTTAGSSRSDPTATSTSAFGDGGSGGDPQGNGQNVNTLARQDPAHRPEQADGRPRLRHPGRQPVRRPAAGSRRSGRTGCATRGGSRSTRTPATSGSRDVGPGQVRGDRLQRCHERQGRRRRARTSAGTASRATTTSRAAAATPASCSPSSSTPTPTDAASTGGYRYRGQRAARHAGRVRVRRLLQQHDPSAQPHGQRPRRRSRQREGDPSADRLVRSGREGRALRPLVRRRVSRLDPPAAKTG